jgi:hypothetical protein
MPSLFYFALAYAIGKVQENVSGTENEWNTSSSALTTLWVSTACYRDALTFSLPL